MQKNFYITTTLPYVNAEPHVGFAMEIIRADIVARYKKSQGFEVFFNTGTDEHGQKLFEAAQKAGKDVKTYVDEYAEKFKDLKTILGISDDVHFIRTTDTHHEKAAQEFWKRVSDNGYIYKKNYKVKYCVGCESEKTESELVEGKCPLHLNRELETIDEENYFFKFSAFGEKLQKFYEDNPNFVIPSFRFNEMKEFVKSGLEDFSISRLKSKMAWGIPVPNDPEHVMYVWFDALVNYISTLGWPENIEIFEKFWKNGTPTQYCGKDNTRFQAVMWQAMLIAADLPNSHTIVIDGFVTGEGGVKMSKSLGNVINPLDVVNEYGAEALRYFVSREISSFEDSPFTMERFKESYNSALANGLGNLVNRVMKMATSYNVTILDSGIIDSVNNQYDVYVRQYTEALNGFNIKLAMDAVWGIIAYANLTIQNKEPFKLIKVNPLEAKKEVAFLLRDLRQIGLMLEPIMPQTAKTIQRLVQENKMPEAPLFLRKD